MDVKPSPPPNNQNNPQNNQYNQQDNLYNQYGPPPQQPDNLIPPAPVEDESGGGRGKKIAIAFLCLILVAATGASAYLLKQEKDQVAQLNKEVAAANSEVSSLKAAQTQPVVEQKEQMSETNAFTAKHAGFTLTLPSQYGYVVARDGTGEGRAFTSVRVGTLKDGVTTVDETADRTILATKYQKGENFQTVLKNSLPEGAKKSKDKQVIAGNNAQIYTSGGITDVRKYYFEKNGTFYEITLVGYEGNETKQNQFIDMISKNLKFN